MPLFRSTRLLSFLLLVLSGSCRPREAAGLPATTLLLPSGKKISVELAVDPQQRTRGLMFRKELKDGSGMLFVFPRQQMLSFWMKNTLIPLDIVFIGADKKITRIAADLEPRPLDTPNWAIPTASGVAQFVLELPAGSSKREGLKPKQPLSFSVPIPKI